MACTDNLFDTDPSYELDKCLALARQPQECRRLFCMSCLLNTQSSDKCPNCGLKPVIFCDVKSQQEVMRLQVKCSNLSNGCQWTGELRSLHTHTEECPYRAVTCLLHKDLEEHCPYTCPRCPSLGKEEPISKETAAHTLKNTIAQDSNKKDSKTKMYSVHEIEHPLQRSAIDTDLLPCKFAMFGCTIQLTAKELKKHQTDDQLHLQITMEKVLELTELLEMREKRFREHTELMNKEIAVLQRDAKTLAIPTAPVVFAVTNFSKKKSEKETVFSPSFYLQPTSYKLHLTVFTNGRENALNSFVSLYVCFDEGVNDEILLWPFRGCVIVELLNQLEDKNHHKRIIDDAEISSRPVAGRHQKMYGYDKFIASRDLNWQYLKDDKLYFRVSEALALTNKSLHA